MEAVQNNVSFTANVDGQLFKVKIERVKPEIRRYYSIRYQKIVHKKFLGIKYTDFLSEIRSLISIDGRDSGEIYISGRYFYTVDLAMKMIKLAFEETEKKIKENQKSCKKLSEINIMSHIE